jgi:prepilin-type processing-associated H-X9-DG protein
MQSYIDENSFHFPPLLKFGPTNTYWFDFIEPYLDDTNVFQCPDYKHYNESLYDYDTQAYAYNIYLTVDGLGYTGKDINSILSVTKCIMLTDSGPPGQSIDGIYYTGRVWRPGDRHSNGTNILFVDGHVAWYPASAIPWSASEEAKLWWNY